MKQWFHAVFISALSLLAMSWPDAAQADAGDPNLQGDWRVVSVFHDGILSPLSEGYVRALIYDNKIVFTRLRGREDPDIYRIDASRTPKALDVEWHIRPYGKVVVTPGIFELENGRLRICQGATRPAEFATRLHDRRTLFVLERDDATEPAPGVSAVAESRQAIVRKIAANLPNGWTCERGPTSIALCRTTEPIIVNLVNTMGTRDVATGETQEELARRYAVDIKYRIVLRFTPKVDPARVQKMVEENEKIQREIENVKRASFFRYGIPDEFEAKSDEERAILGKYMRLLQSLHVLPDGYWGEASVYVMPTNLGFASFLKKEDEAECQRVKQRMISLLTSYSAGSGRAADKQ